MTTPKYKLHWVDADTILYQAAASVQENYIEVTHISSGKVKEFKNITAFKGRSKKTLGGWLGNLNKERKEVGSDTFKLEDFSVENLSRVSGDFGSVEEAIQDAIESIDYKVGSIKRAMDAEDYKLCIGGKGNFRKEYAHTKGYKAHRVCKPLLFEDIRERFIEKYKSKVVIAQDEEAEDIVSIQMYKEFKKNSKTKNWEQTFSYCDKDLRQILCVPRLNYMRLEDGYEFPTTFECARDLCIQLLVGDSVDNILGLPNLSPVTREKYGLPKTRGIAKATADKYLDGCETIKDMFERVVEAYKGYYGVDVHIFKSCHGHEVEWTWEDYLKEAAILLWMRREEGEYYDIFDTLDKLGIDYD